MTERFTVGVVDVGASLRVTKSKGEPSDVIVGQGSSTTTTTSNVAFTDIEFPESARMHGNYTLEPGERKQLSIERIAPNEAIVVLVYDVPEETYRSIKSLSCGGPILGYRVTSQAGGSDDWTISTHSCG